MKLFLFYMAMAILVSYIVLGSVNKIYYPETDKEAVKVKPEVKKPKPVEKVVVVKTVIKEVVRREVVNNYYDNSNTVNYHIEYPATQPEQVVQREEAYNYDSPARTTRGMRVRGMRIRGMPKGGMEDE